MKPKINLLISILIVLYHSPTFAFPGDHNSLTCDKNYVGLKVPGVEGDPNYTINDNDVRNERGDITSRGSLSKYLRRPISELSAEVKADRDKIIAAINADIKNPATSKIFQNVRSNQDNSNYEGHSLQVTKWGDSLSDFVNFYGILTPGALGAGVPIPPIGGIYGGSPLWIDSWSDYFSIYGQPQLSPVYVRNYGIATYQTPTVMDLMGFSSYYDGVNGWWDINPITNKCPKDGKVDNHFFSALGVAPHFQNGKSALHSTLMIGGNDVLNGLVHGNLIPTLGTYTVDLVTENVTFMTDWHLENGKKILLEGTVPAYSGPIDSYDSLIVNRAAICRPLADSFIKPQDIPWWACALGPNVCYAMAKAAKEYDEKVSRAFGDFAKKVMRKNKTAQTQFSDSFYSMNLNNFAGNLGDVFTAGGNVLEQGVQDNIVPIVAVVGGVAVTIGTRNPAAGAATTTAIELELSKQKKTKAEWQGNWGLRLLSISQACINDKINYDIGPAYKAAYPGYVEVLGLYNYFANEGDFNFANNFWVPKNGIYDKYNNFWSSAPPVLGFEGSIVDPIHIGPKGYELWGTLIGTKLKDIGWNRTDDYIDPIVNVDNDGPGKIIKKKSKEVGIFGQESTYNIRIPSYCEDKVNGYGKYGGYQRRYKDGSVIYLRQLLDVPVSDSTTKFDIPHVVRGLHQVRYDQEGGTIGTLGFPTSDKHCTAALACSVEDVDFECGAISDNHLDPIEHFHTNMTSGCITGKVVPCPQTN